MKRGKEQLLMDVTQETFSQLEGGWHLSVNRHAASVGKQTPTE